MRTERFIKNWGEYRQEGQEKYVQKKSALVAGGILVGQSVVKLYRGDLTFFSFQNLILVFVVSYIASYIGSTNLWRRNEKKYSRLTNGIEN